MARIAYQLYSAREEAAKDLGAVLRELSKMGYQGVEFAGFYGNGAREIRALLEEHGLEAVSSHVALDDIRRDMLGVLAFHQALGCKWITVPFLEESDRPGRPGFARVIAVLHRFARLCREAGLGLAYHNHAFEFVPLSGQYALDFLYQAVPEPLLYTQIDTCWVHYAGEQPAAYVQKYAGRCPMVHMKDYFCPETPGAPDAPLPEAFEFRPLGRGCQDIGEIARAAAAAGAQWLVVEQDFPTESPLQDADVSIRALRALNAWQNPAISSM